VTLKINRVPDSPKDYACSKFGQNPLKDVDSKINILQWILTKPGTYLDFKKIWNPIDFQGQRSRSQGLIFRRGDTPRFALPFLFLLRYEYVSVVFVACVFLKNEGFYHFTTQNSDTKANVIERVIKTKRATQSVAYHLA
jgi:hypothetical protein